MMPVVHVLCRGEDEDISLLGTMPGMGLLICDPELLQGCASNAVYLICW